MSETIAYRNHINNSELEIREVFEQEMENIPHTRQKYLVTTLNDNQLTRSSDSSKMKKGTNRRYTWTQNHHFQTPHQRHLHQTQY